MEKQSVWFLADTGFVWSAQKVWTTQRIPVVIDQSEL